jgi:hypothetical protein
MAINIIVFDDELGFYYILSQKSPIRFSDPAMLILVGSVIQLKQTYVPQRYKAGY